MSYGKPNDYGIRHEQWPCGDHAGRTHLCELCTLVMLHDKKPASDEI